jgi:hypothetical protein
MKGRTPIDLRIKGFMIMTSNIKIESVYKVTSDPDDEFFEDPILARIKEISFPYTVGGFIADMIFNSKTVAPRYKMFLASVEDLPELFLTYKNEKDPVLKNKQELTW